MPLSKYRVIGWIVYYGDREISSHDTDFRDLPKDGVIGMVLFEDRKTPAGINVKAIYKGFDYYFKAKGLVDYIYGCDVDIREVNRSEEISERYDDAVILRGIWVDNETLYQMIDNMKAVEWQL